MRYPTIALSFLAAINAFAVDVSTPVFPAAALALNVDIGLMQLTIGLYMLGYGIGQIPIGLMGDYFGRRITVIISLVVFILAGFVAAAAPSVELLLAMRFVQGVSGAAGAVISRAIARDITSGAGTGRLVGLMTVAIGGVMILGPLIGAMLLDLVGWWSPFMASAVFGLLALMLLLTGIEETLKHLRRHPWRPLHRRHHGVSQQPAGASERPADRLCILYSDGFCYPCFRGFHPPLRYG